MPRCPLRFATFLAPNMLEVYQFIAESVGRELGVPTELTVGVSYDQFDTDVDVGFICGLPYVLLMRAEEPWVELLAAPVLLGTRYAGRPIYFSDVIVHRASPFQTFADLRGRSWAYNEPFSHSGFGITRYHLIQMGQTQGYFGKVIESGWHERSVRMVCTGEVDASAIDSLVLAVAVRDDPELAEQLRVIDTLGPSSIQPVVAATRLPDSLKADIKDVILGLADLPIARNIFTHSFIERFVSVSDADYNDIRDMLNLAETTACMTIR